MSFGDFAGLTVVMATFFGISMVLASAYRRRLAYKERRLDVAVSSLSLNAREGELEKRVRVLERIVTQNGSTADIARQIEALRGEPDTLIPSGPSERTLIAEATTQ